MCQRTEQFSYLHNLCIYPNTVMRQRLLRQLYSICSITPRNLVYITSQLSVCKISVSQYMNIWNISRL